jgi:RimJ/RimL family protein N-acetyltransferase
MPEHLDAGVVQLDRVRPADERALVAAISESEQHLSAWMDWLTEPYDAASTARFVVVAQVAWDAGLEYAFVLRCDGVVVGAAAAERKAADLVEIGYWVRVGWTGRGIATAAAAALTRAALELPGVERVQIWHDEANVASGRVPEKLGFRQVERRTTPRIPRHGREAGVDIVHEKRRAR